MYLTDFCEWSTVQVWLIAWRFAGGAGASGAGVDGSSALGTAETSPSTVTPWSATQHSEPSDVFTIQNPSNFPTISAFSPACKLTTTSDRLPGPMRQGVAALTDKEGAADVGKTVGDGGSGVVLGTGIVGVGIGSAAKPGILQEITRRRTVTARLTAYLVCLLLLA